MKIRLALDSGAHSLYKFKFAPQQKKGKGATELRDYDFVESAEFTEYLDGYTKFCHERKDEMEFFVSLDIIFNGKLSYQTYQDLKKNGLDPLPVFHFGEDIKYFKRYMDDTDYIGMGGIGQDISMVKFMDFGRDIFRFISDKHGTPRWKMHGFALTSIQLMKLFPFYSVDSSTWGALSRNGWLRVPRTDEDGNYRWLDKPVGFRTTERSRHSNKHIDGVPPIIHNHIEYYLKTMFKTSIRETKETYMGRDIANLGYYFQTAVALQRYYEKYFGYGEGANFYLAGQPSGAMNRQTMRTLFHYAGTALPKDFEYNYLGTFYYPNYLKKVEESLHPLKRIPFKVERFK